MKKLLSVLVLALALLSCKDSKTSDKILFDSEGKLNDVSVVIGNDNWKGSVGEAIRDVLATPIYGLPQDEPTFIINQIPPQVFSDFITRTRTVLKIELGKPAGIAFADNVYAKPQKVIVVSGNKQEVIGLLKENASKIIETFKGIELKYKQKLTRKSLYNTKVIKDKLGVNIEFQTAYRIAKDDDTFFWIRKDVRTGTLNLMLYELPYHAIQRNDSIINQIVKIRDSIGKAHIEGPTEGSYMITEYAYTPFQSEIILDGKPTLETKGLWEVKNAFMSGPYINYAIEDKANTRWLIAEGFAFAPSVEKRNYIFELESIIKTIRID
ncbi:DUF4837 family protein [Hyunsoonleella sp. SJ7]|uniref:DUF4837 family protein n=1 Tax=Hyunsoonleella aquatilis TaxID=2762758 RepID=A0A923HEU8_9FLAO|nr:DUF4837 family protein [Hyunsoonleella aquatilis]MBC3759881.1 DUF4837 family protein [Hyunsoonleella aquatilis]